MSSSIHLFFFQFLLTSIKERPRCNIGCTISFKKRRSFVRPLVSIVLMENNNISSFWEEPTKLLITLTNLSLNILFLFQRTTWESNSAWASYFTTIVFTTFFSLWSGLYHIPFLESERLVSTPSLDFSKAWLGIGVTTFIVLAFPEFERFSYHITMICCQLTACCNHQITNGPWRKEAELNNHTYLLRGVLCRWAIFAISTSWLMTRFFILFTFY